MLTPTIHGKLTKIQSLEFRVGKNAQNPHFKSNFVSLDNLLTVLLPIATEHKLCISHFLRTRHIVTQVTDTESGEIIESEFPIIQDDPQKIGSAITYGKRYNLGAIFNMITEADDDGHSISGASQKKEQPKTTADNLVVQMGKEKDIENLKTIFAQLYTMAISEEQQQLYKSKYDQAKLRISNNLLTF